MQLSGETRRILLHAYDVPTNFQRVLGNFFELKEVKELVVDEGWVHNADQARLFLKLHALNQLEFDKVLFLDADVLPRRPLDKIFELRAPAGVEVNAGYESVNDEKAPKAFGLNIPMERLIDPATGEMRSRINAGVLLLRPCKSTFTSLVATVRTPPLHRELLCCSMCPEEDLLTKHYANHWTSLGSEYNLEMWRGYATSVEAIKAAYIFHFSCKFSKPFWTTQILFESDETVARMVRDYITGYRRDPHGLLEKATCEWRLAYNSVKEALKDSK